MPPDPEDHFEPSMAPAEPEPGPDSHHAGRPYLRLWFRCAGQYARAYMNAQHTGYTGRCPSCGKAIRFRIAPGGTSDRFFEVSC